DAPHMPAFRLLPSGLRPRRADSRTALFLREPVDPLEHFDGLRDLRAGRIIVMTVRIERALRIIARGGKITGARKCLRVDAPQIALVARIVATARRSNYTQRLRARAQGGGRIS